MSRGARGRLDRRKIQNAVRRYVRRKRSREGADATERVMTDVRERALKCGLLVLKIVRHEHGVGYV